jgi:hypothetical protein
MNYELAMDLVFAIGLVVIVVGATRSFRYMWKNRRRYY